MSPAGDLWAWAAIGAACSLVGMIHPFRRGVVGIAFNAVGGMAGAVLLGLLAWTAMDAAPLQRRLWCIPFAAAGAFGVIALMHYAYRHAVRARRE